MNAQYAMVSDADLLTKLIGVRAARNYEGSLKAFFGTSSKNGAAHEKCRVARELVRRWIGEELRLGCVLSNPAAVRQFLQVHFNGQEYESFVVLYLDVKNRLIASEEMFRGTLTRTSVYPREVVKACLANNAAGVILAHNHPSGATEPSGADESLTNALRSALALVEVRVLDHIIVAGPDTLSFAERGLI